MINYTKQLLLYRGKAKSIYTTQQTDKVIMVYHDDASAFNGKKKSILQDKGMVNNLFNAHIMNLLNELGIKTHFIKTLTDTESLVYNLQMLPVECVVRNYAAGSICKRLDITRGKKFARPIFEFFYKSDPLNDPLVNDEHIMTLNLATADEIQLMRKIALFINDRLISLFEKAGLLLVDYKLEFGRKNGDLLLGDEFSPDGCRLWDKDTKESFDKDRFRENLGNVVSFYKQVAIRIGLNL